MQFCHSMSIVLSLVPYFLFPYMIRAGPLSTVSLAPDLTGVVPPCAQSCVKSLISQNFPTCRQQRDLDCFCTNNSVSGLTLGEEALSCLASTCSFDVLNAQAIPVYEVCQGVPGFKSMTHTILTATQSSFTSVSAKSHIVTSSLNDTSSTSTAPSSTSTQSAGTVTPTNTTTAIATPFGSASVTSSSSSFASINTSSIIPKPTAFTTTSASVPSTASSTQSLAVPTSSPAAPAASPVLTKPQIAGVTVAGAGAAAISFGILFFIFCRRRRRQNPNKRNSGSSFGGDEIIENQRGSLRSSTAIVGNPERDDQSRSLPANVPSRTPAVPATGHEGRWSIWPSALESEGIGASVGSTRGSEAVHDSPHTSTTTRRTNSQLLPDKPSYSLYPSPLRIKTPISPIAGSAGVGQRTRTPLTKPSPRGRNSSDTSQAYLQYGRFNEQVSPMDPFVDPQPRSSPSTQRRPKGQFSPSQLPPPIALNHGPWTRSAETIRKPVPARQSLSAPRSQPLLTRSQPGLGIGTSTGSPRSLGLASSDVLPSSDPLSSKFVPRRKSSRRRPPTHFSMDSDTSFEDAGDEDEIPGHRQVLSPVTERSPPSQVRYPQIPGSVVPIAQHQPSLGSPTRRPRRPRIQVELNPLQDKSLPRPPLPLDNPASLLAKRRGDQKASELAEGLRNREVGEDELRQTAKWKILVSPGLEGIKDAGTPTTFGSPRTAKSGDWTGQPWTRGS